MVAAESASRPSISAAYEPSKGICDAIEALEEDRERLYNLQLQAEVFQPLNVDLRLAGEGLLLPRVISSKTAHCCACASAGRAHEPFLGTSAWGGAAHAG